MGRHVKEVRTASGLDRRESGYYSTPDYVANYICHRMMTFGFESPRVFDPCIGAGELIQSFLNFDNAQVVGFDVLAFSLPGNVRFHKQDFLEWYSEKEDAPIFGRSIDIEPNIIVANPPYNCHENDYIRANKPWLSKSFSNIGVHNMYSMFLAAIIDIAPPGAAIGIITLDSFMTSRHHEQLRRMILEKCAIHEIALCPTDVFKDQGADVRTCILILQKGKQFQKQVRTLNRLPDRDQFKQALRTPCSFSVDNLDSVVLETEGDRLEFCVGVPREVWELFDCKRLGDEFPCITGISTGNDAKYLSSIPKKGFTIPFYKNPGTRKFFCEPNAFLIDDYMEEANRTTNFMVRNKALLTKGGICCSSMGVDFSACYRPPGSVFGVNTNVAVPKKDLWWVLTFLNSSVSRFLVRGVLMRSNMVTSGYVSRLPLPPFSTETKSQLSALGVEMFELAKSERFDQRCQNRIDNLVFDALQLSEPARECITRFCSDVVRLT